jgi:hypothetical protein
MAQSRTHPIAPRLFETGSLIFSIFDCPFSIFPPGIFGGKSHSKQNPDLQHFLAVFALLNSTSKSFNGARVLKLAHRLLLLLSTFF